jgi:protein TonB
VDESAIPISGKQAKPQQETAPKTAQHQPQPQQDNVAKYGEQAGSSMPRSMQLQGFSSGQTTLSDGDFGTRFGWYVDNLNRKMATSWYKAEVDPHTPRGARVYLTFTVNRAGSPFDVQIDRSSGSATLDRSCQRGVQRVDTFGQLPSAYNQSTLKVSYYCEY